MRLKISSPSLGTLFAETTEENRMTVEGVIDALPLEGKANLWGDEIYFSADIPVEPEHGRELVQEGEIAVWVEEPSICIFFGKTPISKGSEIRACSPVNVFAKIEGDLSPLRRVKQGEHIRIEK